MNKNYKTLTLLFAVTYMISYITRINFGAIISEIETSEGIARNLLSLSVTGSFITYGVGQVISGFLGDRISPKKIVACGFLITIMMNLLIPLCRNPYQMLFVWCINGFAQSLMWPPIVKLMTARFSDDEYKKASVKVSLGSSFGTMFIYLFSPIMITLFSWKGVFIFSSLVGIIMLIVWISKAPDVSSENTNKNAKSEGLNFKVMFSPTMICIMIAIILQGMLRDGITTWMPSYISETYNISNVISILTGVVLPLFSILCFNVTSALYRKKFTNPVFCAGVIFSIGAISALLLSFFSGKSASLSVILSAVLSGSMHGVNLLLICMIPPFFKKYGNVSTVSGIINACVYIGSAISTYSIALLSEKLGWSFTIFTWLACAVAGAFLCFICSKPWKKQYQS